MNRKLTAITIIGGFIILLVTMALAPPVFADTHTWKQNACCYYDIATNWNEGSAPSGSDTAIIGTGDTATLRNNQTVGTAQVDNGTLQPGWTGETYTFTNLKLGTVSGQTGIFAHGVGGTVNITNADIGVNGSGILRLNAANYNIYVANTINLGVNSGSTGTVEFRSNGRLYLASGGIQKGSGTANVYIGAIPTSGNELIYWGTATNINVTEFSVGKLSSYAGTFTLPSGKTITAVNEYLASEFASGTFRNSGTNNVTDTLIVGVGNAEGSYYQDAGTSNINNLQIANTQYRSSYYYLNGGTTNVTNFQSGVGNAYISGSGAMNVSGNWTANSSGVLTFGSSTINFNGSGTQTLNSGGKAFNNLTHSGSGVLQLSTNNLTVNGALNNSAGVFYLNGRGLTVPTSGFSNAGTLRLQGGETLSAFNRDVDSGTVEYVGSGSTPYNSLNYLNNYYNLRINSTSGTNTFSPNGALTVNNDLQVLSGTLNTGSHNISVLGNTTVNGTLAGSGALNISSGNVLKGTGTIGLDTTIASGGIINPGNSPGTMVIDGAALTWAPGGTAIFEIRDAAGIAGTDWDLIRLINGATLDITATSGDPFTVIFRGIDPITGLPGDPDNFSPLQEFSWLFVDDAGGTISGFDISKFAIQVEGFTAYDTFTLVEGSMKSEHQLTKVPEIPAGVALPLLALLGSAMILLKKKFFGVKRQ